MKSCTRSTIIKDDMDVFDGCVCLWIGGTSSSLWSCMKFEPQADFLISGRPGRAE